MITREKDLSEGTTTRYKTTIPSPTSDQEQDFNETIVTLRIPKSYYKTAYAVAHLLGYDSFEEYVNDEVIEGIEMEIDGRGSLECGKDEDLRKLLLGEK